MARKDLKRALGTSLKAEEAAVEDRFKRADSVLARGDLVAAAKAEPLPEIINGQPMPDEQRVKRDSFTMPNSDYELIAILQKRCLQAQVSASKSEILRAGLTLLNGLSPEELGKLLESLPKVKTGRPPQNHS